MDTSSNEHDNDIEVLIFCDGAVNKEASRLGACIAYKNDGVVMAKLAKFKEYKDGDTPLMVEVLAVEVALNLAVQCGWRKVGFF